MIEQEIRNLKNAMLSDLEKASSEGDIFQVEKKYLGRKGQMTQVLRRLKDMPIEERKNVGEMANKAKAEMIDRMEEIRRIARSKAFDFEAEKIDVTMPGNKIKSGHLHPLTRIQNEIEDIFVSMGFEIADGPEVETEWYNFDALNIPKDHPARDKWDTFWLRQNNQETRNKKQTMRERILLRTHTSPVQVRYMQEHEPPFRIIVPGRCFRNEATDATHDHTFNQFEALVVSDDVNVGHFKYIGEQFFSRFFKRDVKVRLRPSFFPFTEPSFEFDISCTVCGGGGCPACKGGGWLEIGGAGMVNQKVFEAAGYPKGKYQGFAWGFGIERLGMMKYKINDVRLFHSGDLRFVSQFR